MREKIYYGLHVNCQLSLTDFDRDCNVSKKKKLVKMTNMKLNENPFCVSHVVACGQTDMVKLTGAFFATLSL
jgi:hypothetical protein